MLDKMRGRPDLALRWRAVSSHWQSRPANEEFITGDCWADLVDDDRAAASYRRVTDLYPDIPEGWIGLCRLKLLEGDFAAARKIYRENIDSYREYGFARQMAAQVEFRLATLTRPTSSTPIFPGKSQMVEAPTLLASVFNPLSAVCVVSPEMKAEVGNPGRFNGTGTCTP